MPSSKDKRLKGYPAGYAPDEGAPDVFDPALKHYPRAYVKGTPTLSESARASLLHEHSRAIEICVHALCGSPLRDHLVARGSATLAHWYGERARAAKDLDLVVVPETWLPTSEDASRLLAEVREVASSALAEHFDVIAAETSIDGIWTYERAEGRRIVIPWSQPEHGRQQLQIDVVFAEPLCSEPVLESVGDSQLWFASRMESLAWKLLWLEDDMWPQGKDLYDAVLLAEDTPLPVELLRSVFSAKSEWQPRYADPGFVLAWEVDWDNFALEYPQLAQGTARDWLERLHRALRLVP
jgi:hypothetical protein